VARLGKRYRSILIVEQVFLSLRNIHVTLDDFLLSFFQLPDEATIPNVQQFLKKDHLMPLLYSVIHRQTRYNYATFADRTLIDFPFETSLAFMLATIVALYYVFDVHYPTPNKPLLEILDHTIFAGGTIKSNKAKLTTAAQQALLEFEQCERR
jgi:hypothetical protein